ncbi:MAG TPA: hypothetical protein VMU34_06390, partial [Mycobacterium sp.]|nr:hypothetical protein [Mycobacterium sp.]
GSHEAAMQASQRSRRARQRAPAATKLTSRVCWLKMVITQECRAETIAAPKLATTTQKDVPDQQQYPSKSQNQTPARDPRGTKVLARFKSSHCSCAIIRLMSANAVNRPETVPRGLKTRGKTLWCSVTAAYSLNPAERELLLELCRGVDTLDRLHAELAAGELVGANGRANPLLREISDWRKVALLLHRRLALPDDRVLEQTSASRRAAANVRWHGKVKGA